MSRQRRTTAASGPHGAEGLAPRNSVHNPRGDNADCLKSSLPADLTPPAGHLGAAVLVMAAPFSKLNHLSHANSPNSQFENGMGGLLWSKASAA